MLTLKAHVEAGRVVVDDRIELPDGTELELAPVVGDDMDDAQRATLEAALRRSADQVRDGRLVPL